jgi:predicted dehydrogenase
VFGVGSLGQHHARVYSELAEADLIGVYDVDARRAAEVAARHETRAFSDMGELAAAVEAASVVVPTDRHFEVACALMRAGKHLLVEKPIASSTDEAEGMVRLARERDVVLQVGHIERFNPVMQFLEQRLTRPRFIEATRLAPYPPPRPEGGAPRGTEVSVVLDLMIHDLEIILHLVGAEVESVDAVGVSVLSPSEDIANVRLRFANGCVANVTASRISQKKLREIRVFQEDSYLSLDYMNQKGHIARRAGGGIETTAVPIEKEEPLKAELASFVRCVRTRGTPRVSGEHGSRALRLAVDICRHIRGAPS